jgi:hypothetical protein
VNVIIGVKGGAAMYKRTIKVLLGENPIILILLFLLIYNLLCAVFAWVFPAVDTFGIHSITAVFLLITYIVVIAAMVLRKRSVTHEIR